MNEEMSSEIPDILFITLHTSGNIIYTYPSLGGREHVLSSLVSAIFSLEEKFSGETYGITKGELGKMRSLFKREGEIIYSLFVSNEYNRDFQDLLSKLVRIVDKEFPGEIVDGLIKVTGETNQLTKEIAKTINNYTTPQNIIENRGTEKKLSLTDIIKLMGKETLVKIFRGLLAEKTIVIFSYDHTLFSKIAQNIASYWPENIKITYGSEIISFKETDNNLIIAKKKREEKIRKNTKEVMIIDYSQLSDEDLSEDMLLMKINKILKMEDKEESQELYITK